MSACQNSCDTNEECGGFSINYDSNPEGCTLIKASCYSNTSPENGVVSYLQVPQCLPHYPCSNEYPYLVQDDKTGDWQCQKSKTDSTKMRPSEGSCFYSYGLTPRPQYCTECQDQASCYSPTEYAQVTPITHGIYQAYTQVDFNGCAIQEKNIAQHTIPPTCHNLTQAEWLGRNTCENLNNTDCSKSSSCAMDVNAGNCNLLCSENEEGEYRWDCTKLYKCTSLCNDLSEDQCNGSVCLTLTEEEACKTLPTCKWNGTACSTNTSYAHGLTTHAPQPQAQM